MRSQTLEEFAEDMRRKGDIRDADLADEILMLVDLEAEVAEPYSDLIADLENYAPEGLRDKPEKAMEWLGDRSNELDEIAEQFKKAKRTAPVADEVESVLATMDDARLIIGAPDDCDYDVFLDELRALADRASKLSNDLEYDL